MAPVEWTRYVTEWGFPVVRWRDRISEMKGHPQDPLPRVKTTELVRTLWIDRDGARLMYDGGRGAEVLGVRAGARISGGSTRKDLSGEQARLVGLSRLRWIEHQTLTLTFGDEEVKRIAVSAVSEQDMLGLHRAIEQNVLNIEDYYEPPEDGDGVCWPEACRGAHAELKPDEKSRTAVDAGSAACGEMEVTAKFPVPAVRWMEPVRSRGRFGFGARYHRIDRKLFVTRGHRRGQLCLVLRSYKPGDDGVIEVLADFGFLKGFRVIEGARTKGAALGVVERAEPGLSVVADFRYGLTVPLTCCYVRDGYTRKSIDVLVELLNTGFLPLVGQELTDEALDDASRV
jgi:hypothetical protein